MEDVNSLLIPMGLAVERGISKSHIFGFKTDNEMDY
jgi:hypothetical protein